jgi:hypothetical protein
MSPRLIMAARKTLRSTYVQSLSGRLGLHFLPGYAPELNPDELIWNHLKRQGVSKKPLRKDESLHSRMQADLDAIKARPALVRSFFRAPSVAYTTDRLVRQEQLQSACVPETVPGKRLAAQPDQSRVSDNR